MARRPGRTSTSRDPLAGLQLGLPLDLQAPELYFRRERHWPRTAPAPRELTPAANRLGLLLRERLHRARTDLGKLTITASASQWAQTRRLAGCFEVDLHWRALDDIPLTLVSLLSAISGDGFPRAFCDRMSEIVGPNDVYARRSSASESRPSRHDLGERLADVAHHLPDPSHASALTIGWGRPSASGAGRSVRLGVMRTRERHIVIHPVLDHPFVPTYVLDGVVFHELCHWVAPPLTSTEQEQRRDHRIHHREFRALEERYPLRDQSDLWIKENLAWILANC